MSASACPACSKPVAADFRLCPYCGAELAAPAPAREERKVVTVLFCDLVGFTQRSEAMDPEDVRALLRGYHEHLRGELERFGGRVEKFIGDAVVAVFGAPVAHEDDPERAVRAALAIRDWARGEDGLELRIAVHTGEALVTLGAGPERGEAMVAGDVVNTAARLQGAAPTNGILVGETTYRATRDRIDSREAEPVAAKGKAEPVAVWEALEARSRLGVDVEQRAPTPFVGRTRELDVLLDALARARDDQKAQLVTLVGVPGMGKSRLVWELFRRVEAEPELVTWRQGRSLPYGEGRSFWALGEMVKAQAGILETDSPDAAEQKLAAAVDAAVGADAWVQAHLAPLIGLRADGTATVDSRDEAFAAWRRFFEALAEQRPLVLVFEDLHWADDTLLDFVDHLVDWASGVPLLVLGTARPELLDRRPGWSGGKLNASTLALSPLLADESARLIAAVLERALLPAEAQAALLDRAGGNPLYAEQYALLYRERGETESLVPESVHGIIAARLDLLPEQEKLLLQDAAVVGKVFWPGALRRDRTAAAAALHALERKDFVRRERRSSVEGEDEYAFRHMLVRDVAYEQIPRASRSEKHRLAGEWIEALARPEDHAEVLAHHYLSAFELARAAGRATDALADRARIACRQAGDTALGLSVFSVAVQRYAQALELWPRDDAERGSLLLAYGRALRYAEQRGDDALLEAREILLAEDDLERAAEADATIGELLWERDGDSMAALEYLRRAVALLERLPSSLGNAYALAALSRVETFAGNHEETIRRGREAIAIAEELRLDEVLAHALQNVGIARFNMGDAGGVADVERALEVAVAANSVESLRAYSNLSALVALQGDFERSDALEDEGLRAAERFGHAVEVRAFQTSLLFRDFQAGRWDDVQASEVDAIRPLRISIRVGRGDLAGALEEAVAEIEHMRRSRPGETVAMRLTLGLHGFVLARLGRSDEASAAREELRRYVGDHPAPVLPWEAPWLRQLGLSDEIASLFLSGELAATDDAVRSYVEGDFLAAADRYATLRLGFLEAEARLRSAESLLAAGERKAGEEQLGRALAFFTKAGATAYIREAEALLAATA